MRDSRSRRVPDLRRLTVLGVAVSAMVPLVAGVAVLPGAAASPAAASPAAASPAAASPGAGLPARLAAQTIAWVPCLDPEDFPGLPRDFYRMRCGTFTAPADWADPDDGRTVTVAVSRLPASVRPARGVTFTNPGGPGEPGLELPLVFSLAGRTALLRTQDVYGIDVRGTGASTNLTCGGPPLQSLLDPRDRSAANLDLILDAADLVARFCAAAPGLPIERVTTAATVRDLDLLRSLVKAPKVNWIGYSAGTWLGAHYAAAFPARTGRFVLDSTTDVTGTWQDAFELQPMGFERRFRRDFMRWAARHHGVLGLGRTPGQVLARYEGVRARLTPQAPVDSAVLLDLTMAGAMYTGDLFVPAALLIADLDAFLDAQDDGDAVAMAAARARVTASPVARAAAGRLEGRTPVARRPMASDAVDATFLAITCNDTAWSGGRAELVTRSAALGERYPLLGAGTLNEPCAFWRVTTPHLAPPAGAGRPPVLLVQAAHDPATPLEGARRTAAALPGARMLTVIGEGDHALYAGGNACVDTAVEAWVVGGRLPKAGATCRGKGLPNPTLQGMGLTTAGRDGARAPMTGPSAAGGSTPERAAPPGNPLLGLERVRAAVRRHLTCGTGAAAGC